jgi:hypothetical protein
MNAQPAGKGAVSRSSPEGGTLADVLDRVLDKGIVVDAWASVSLLGIEIVSIQAKVVVASVETYLKYADAIASVGLPPAESQATKPKPIDVKEVKGAEPPKAQVAPKALAENPRPQTEMPSEAAIVDYLTEHAQGLQLDELSEHFHAAKEELEKAVGHLVKERKARRDKARNLILPVEHT